MPRCSPRTRGPQPAVHTAVRVSRVHPVGASYGIKELPQVGVQGKEGAPERHLRSGGEEEIQDGFSPSLV